MFGAREDFFGSGKTEKMRFKAGADAVDVTFIDTNLQMYLDDDAKTPINFNMLMGWIDPKFQSATYFDHF
jgi:hypothetical protein